VKADKERFVAAVCEVTRASAGEARAKEVGTKLKCSPRAVERYSLNYVHMKWEDFRKFVRRYVDQYG
jgi:hypothetical protein